MKNTEKPKASVCIVTYNQEKFIQECLDSILSQKTNFEFEVIVGDDGSTDQTPEIIKDYEKRHKNVKAVLHKENIGPKKNLASVYSKALGDYIFHLDGDDTALPGKIQAQVDALDENPDCMICSHAVENIDKDSKKTNKVSGLTIRGKKDISFLILNLPFFAHSSKAFRNIEDVKGESFFDEIDFDFELHLKHAEHGKIIHIPKVLGCYRVLTGVATKGNRINPEMVEAKSNVFNKLISSLKEEKEIDTIKHAYAKSMLSYAHGSLALGCNLDFKDYVRKSLKIKIISTRQIISFLVSYLPEPAISSMSKLTQKINSN